MTIQENRPHQIGSLLQTFPLFYTLSQLSQPIIPMSMLLLLAQEGSTSRGGKSPIGYCLPLISLAGNAILSHVLFGNTESRSVAGRIASSAWIIGAAFTTAGRFELLRKS